MVRALVVASLVSLAACSAVRPSIPASSNLAAQLRGDGFEAPDALALQPWQIAQIREAVGGDGRLDERMARLARWLTDGAGLAFRYTPDGSFTASEAFTRRSGNCMAFANLFRGAAAALGGETYFVHVTESPSHFESGAVFYYSSHIAAAYGDGAAMRVVDLKPISSAWRPALYRPISDRDGEALYLSNLAVDQLLSGDATGAVRLLRALVGAAPELPELYNNLGAALLRARAPAAALEVFAEGQRRFPSYAPLYSNAILAARNAGLPERAKEIEARACRAAADDPFYLFGEGLELYQRADYPGAAAMFERAARAQPASAEIHAWRARAWFSAGQPSRAREAIETVRRLAPTHPALVQFTM